MKRTIEIQKRGHKFTIEVVPALEKGIKISVRVDGGYPQPVRSIEGKKLVFWNPVRIENQNVIGLTLSEKQIKEIKNFESAVDEERKREPSRVMWGIGRDSCKIYVLDPSAQVRGEEVESLEKALNCLAGKITLAQLLPQLKKLSRPCEHKASLAVDAWFEASWEDIKRFLGLTDQTRNRPQQKATVRCWECGREFSLEEAEEMVKAGRACWEPAGFYCGC